MIDFHYRSMVFLSSAQNAAIRSLPENVVKGLPSERLDEDNPLVQSGEQCRLCLRVFQIGQHVRRLPCRHQFHIDCIGKFIECPSSSAESFVF